MNYSSLKSHATPLPGWCRLLVALLVCAASLCAQRFDITPLVGGMFGGTIKLEEQGIPNFETHLDARLSYGIAGGFLYDADDCKSCNLIEFRWVRQHTHLEGEQDPIVVTPFTDQSFRAGLTLDHFLGDFTREFRVEESKKLRPFVTATLGVVRMSTPEAATARFVFGIGTGLKIFPSRHWGIRFQGEYLPIVMHPDLQRVVCAGGCVVALGGGIMNQFQLSAGPEFRFGH